MSESTEQPFVSIPNVTLPDPPSADAPPIRRANYAHSLFVALEKVCDAAAASSLPPKFRTIAAIIDVGAKVGDELTSDPTASPASLGQP